MSLVGLGGPGSGVSATRVGAIEPDDVAADADAGAEDVEVVEFDGAPAASRPPLSPFSPPC